MNIVIFLAAQAATVVVMVMLFLMIDANNRDGGFA